MSLIKSGLLALAPFVGWARLRFSQREHAGPGTKANYRDTGDPRETPKYNGNSGGESDG